MQQAHEPLISLYSAPILACARYHRRQVVEANHLILAECIGLEPYSPCQVRAVGRGQGGVQDVQSGVELAVESPAALPALEHLAHPISARFARHTSRAGLAGVLRIDLDEGDARGEGLVLDLAVEFALRPRREAAVRPAGPPATLRHLEVLKDESRLPFSCGLDETFRDEMEPLLDAVVFPAALAGEEVSPDPAVVGLLFGESTPSAEVYRLDFANLWEGDGDEGCVVAFCDHAIETGLVGVEGDSTLRSVRDWCGLPDHDHDLSRDERKRTKPPCRIREDGPVPVREREVKFDVFARSNGDAEPPSFPIKPITLVVRFHYEFTKIGETSLLSLSSASSIVLQRGECDLERRVDVAFIDVMLRREVRINGLLEFGPRTDVLGMGYSDALVSDEAKLPEQQSERGRESYNREDQIPDDLLHDEAGWSSQHINILQQGESIT